MTTEQWLNDWQPSSSVMASITETIKQKESSQKEGVDCLASVAVSNV